MRTSAGRVAVPVLGRQVLLDLAARGRLVRAAPARAGRRRSGRARARGPSPGASTYASSGVARAGRWRGAQRPCADPRPRVHAASCGTSGRERLESDATSSGARPNRRHVRRSSQHGHGTRPRPGRRGRRDAPRVRDALDGGSVRRRARRTASSARDSTNGDVLGGEMEEAGRRVPALPPLERPLDRMRPPARSRRPRRSSNRTAWATDRGGYRTKRRCASRHRPAGAEEVEQVDRERVSPRVASRVS